MPKKIKIIIGLIIVIVFVLLIPMAVTWRQAMSGRTYFLLMIICPLVLFIVLPIIVIAKRSISKKIKIIVVIACVLGILLILPVFITVNCFATNGAIMVGGEPCPPGMGCFNDYQEIHVSKGECIMTTLSRGIRTLPKDILKIFK